MTEALRKYFPTSTLITGQDILFFWVARMMMMQLAVVDQIPFDTVYLHGLVRDAKGKKMSKSTGNVMDPLEIIDEFGADALRFTNAAMASLGGVLKIDMARITGYRNFGTKRWNALRFAEMNEATTGQVNAPRPSAPQEPVNKWIIGEVGRVRVEVDAALEAYRFNDAASALYAFVWGKVCDWYVEFSKPLVMGDKGEAAKAETQATMAWVMDQCLILLHPIMPFITEELWGTTGTRDQMLVHADWPTYGAELADKDADREMNWAISLIEAVRSARGEMNIPVGLKMTLLELDLDAPGAAALKANETLIKRLARIETLDKADAAPKGAITLTVDGGTFCLPLDGVIDVAAEKDRLTKAMGKLDKDLNGLRGRLKNPKFAESAPPEVVAETQELLASKEADHAKLTAALARIADMG